MKLFKGKKPVVKKPVKKTRGLATSGLLNCVLTVNSSSGTSAPRLLMRPSAPAPNCQYVYKGRVCPQCGQPGTWSRYTWRQAFFNFLDIWGLGNRPMFRTLRELFWRLGYMIRDYLAGHRQFYFPPFKLMAVSIALLIFTHWLTGSQQESLLHKGLSRFDNQQLSESLSASAYALFDTLIRFFEFLSGNLLYEYLFYGAFLVVCIWLSFRRDSRYIYKLTFDYHENKLSSDRFGGDGCSAGVHLVRPVVVGRV